MALEGSGLVAHRRRVPVWLAVGALVLGVAGAVRAEPGEPPAFVRAWSAPSASLEERVEKTRTAALELANQKLAASNKALKKLVVRDGLTGVHNHRYLHEYLYQVPR